ncbi:MAG: YncE family protein [Planctomycetota bacterium]
MDSRKLLKTVSLCSLLALVPACGSGGGETDPNATAVTMDLVEVTNGFGRLLPYVVPVADPVTGLPTAQLLEIRTIDDLINNPPTVLNPVKPPATWPTQPINPAGRTGNHFVAVKFSRSLDLDSVLDGTATGLANNGLTGALTVVAYDPVTGQSEPVEGRGFINGRTYVGTGPTLERWVRKDGQNAVTARDIDRNGTVLQPGVGFPGTNDDANGIVDGSFVGAGQLVNQNTFVFVVDTDQNLSTYETFPADRVIRVVIKGIEENQVVGGVRSADNRVLEQGGVATSIVGADGTPPDVLLDGLGGSPVTVPANLATDLPCDSEIRFSFGEACQPYSVGPLPSTVPPALSNEFTVEFLPPVSPGSPPPGQTVQLPYTVEPVSPFNFTEYRIVPVVNFPGSDPFGAQAQATVTYFKNAATDLFGNQDGSSSDTVSTTFSIGADCPGLVNVPVAPGAIVVASNGGGTTGGIRVIDLDGFGQGTGDPTFDSVNPFYNVTFNQFGEPIAGDVSKFPFNPNLGVPDIFPPLTADSTSLAGGSRGVMTLAQDSTLRTQLVSPEVTGTAVDMMLGYPLDIAFNNFECLSGGRNLCANAAFQVHPLNGAAPRAGNSISHSPHPNPPRIQLAPACFAPLIQTEEPTFNDANRDGAIASNLLVPGDPFGSIGGFGPSGLLTESLNYAGFWGPAPTSPTCPTFTLRQQIGHFLYVLDTASDQVVVLNSNRMNVIETIPVSDPRDLAISPDLNTLAVSNNGPSTITFIDTNPNSNTFHQVVKVSQLVDDLNNRKGLGPTEVVWQPDGEDILVLCERSGSLALLSGASLDIRKIIPGVDGARYLAVSARDAAFGFTTGLYYAYVVSQSGEMDIFESGPDGVQGIGFDDFISQPTLDGRTGFNSPSALLIDPSSTQHAVFIAYNDGSSAAVDLVWLENAPFGAQLIRIPPGAVVDPSARSKEWKVRNSYTDVFSSSSILDLAVDDLNNVGGLTQALAVQIGGQVFHSGKGLHRAGAPVSTPRFLFAASSSGFVDVIALSTGTRFVSPVPVPGASVLCHYWRQ